MRAPIRAHSYGGRFFVPRSSDGTLEPLESILEADRLPCPLPKDSGTKLLLEEPGTLHGGCARDTGPGAVPRQVRVGEGTPSRAWRGAALQGATTGHSGLTVGGGCSPPACPGVLHDRRTDHPREWGCAHESPASTASKGDGDVR